MKNNKGQQLQKYEAQSNGSCALDLIKLCWSNSISDRPTMTHVIYQLEKDLIPGMISKTGNEKEKYTSESTNSSWTEHSDASFVVETQDSFQKIECISNLKGQAFGSLDTRIRFQTQRL